MNLKSILNPKLILAKQFGAFTRRNIVACNIVARNNVACNNVARNNVARNIVARKNVACETTCRWAICAAP